MSLLCILSDNAEQVVSREAIIKEIWNDYGGADEGLNQAISVLRKILDDREKKLIETIPKKGYVLHAAIAQETMLQPEKAVTVLIEKKSRKISFTIPLLVILLIATWLIFRNRPGRPESSDILNSDQVADTSRANQMSKDSGINPDIQKPDSSAAPDIKKQ